MRRATVWLRAAAEAVTLGAEIYPSEKDQSSCWEMMDVGEDGFHLHLFFPSLGRELLGSHRWLRGTEENSSIISCPSVLLVSLGQERLRSLNQGKKEERANLQQTELLKSGGFANHSLSHLWFFWPRSCIAQYLGGLSKSKQLILPSGSKFILRSFGNTVQKYPDRLISGIFLLSVSSSRKITLSILHVL